MLKQIKIFFTNLYRYKNILYKDRSYDYEYLLELERTKLLLMINYFSKGSYKENTKIVRWMSICVKLIDIIESSDSSFEIISNKYIVKKYVNTKNAFRFSSFERDLTYSIKGDKSDNDIIIKDLIRQQKAWYLYHKIRYNYMQTWWD